MYRLSKVIILTIIYIVLSVKMSIAETLPTGMLPDGIVPTTYQIDLTVSPSETHFSGDVRISVAVEKKTQLIWLHGQGFDVSDSYLLDANNQRIDAVYEEVEKSGIVKLVLAKPVGPGDAVIVIKYSGEFNKSAEGLYKATSKGRSYIYTHLQPLAARQVFPGFDEPRFKTPFIISVNIPSSDVAISNGPDIKNTILENGRKSVQFKKTQPIPTYLVALAVGDFDVVEWAPISPNAVRSRPIALRGIAPKGEGGKFTFALKHTEAMMEILEDYFQSPYPYAKLDLIAPVTFLSGGMENVGAISYRKDIILVDENPSIYQVRSFANVHAHELAHSWFGNLVTPVWWDDLWLNESFATWMAGKVTHAWRPEQFNDRNAIRQGNWAMNNDKLVSARQIRQPVVGNNDIVNAFDSITYSKGASVLSMIERYMGPEVFKMGIQRFITKYRHKVATADDFFTVLSETAEDPGVIAAFRSFVEQPGTPLVSAKWHCDDGGKTRVTLNQSRSLPLGSRGKSQKEWAIPLCLSYGDTQARFSQCLLLSEATQNIDLPTSQCPAWIHPNADGAAYVNFSLSERHWGDLIRHKDMLKPSEVLSAMSSIKAAYSAGKVSTEQLLKFSRAAAGSQSWDVSKAPMQALREINLFVAPKEQQSKFQALMRQVYEPSLERFDLSYEALSKDVDSSNQALMRGDLIWFMALDAKDSSIREKLSKLGQDYLGYGSDNQLHEDRVHPNLVRAAITVALQELGLPFANELIERLEQSNSHVLQGHIISALGYQSDPELRERVWSLILNPTTRKDVASRLLRRQGQRVHNQAALFDWITSNYDLLMARLPSSHRAWTVWRLSGTCSQAGHDKVKSFFTEKVKSHRGAPRALKNVLEKIEICASVAQAQRSNTVQVINSN